MCYKESHGQYTAVIPGGLTPVLQPLDKCISKPFKAKVRAQYEAWMVNGPFTYTPSGKKRAPSKEMVLRWIDRAWREIPVELITRSFISCAISNALDGAEDGALWDDEEEEAEDTEERIDHEFGEREVAANVPLSEMGEMDPEDLMVVKFVLKYYFLKEDK